MVLKERKELKERKDIINSLLFFFFCLENLPAFPAEGEEKPVTFKRILLHRCQEEFNAQVNFDKELEGLEGEDRIEKEFKLKFRVMGNVQFIGELHNRQLLPESVMHWCSRTLIGKEKKERKD